MFVLISLGVVFANSDYCILMSIPLSLPFTLALSLPPLSQACAGSLNQLYCESAGSKGEGKSSDEDEKEEDSEEGEEDEDEVGDRLWSCCAAPLGRYRSTLP